MTGNKLNGVDCNRTRRLAQWAIASEFDQLPDAVVERTKDFFLDWIGCCVAGREHVSVTSMLKFANTMGPADGACELVGFPGHRTSPYFAAMINGASSHVVEQDDLHNSSMMHPATVVFPAALAVAQDMKSTGKEFIVASVVGYEFACRVGRFLGKEHYKHFHTTATAGVIGATAAASRLLKLDLDTFVSAIGTAGTQAAGLWQFLLDATHSKQVHTAKACANGVYSAYLAAAGLLGPHDILEGKKGMAATLCCVDSDPTAIDGELGTSWSIMESSFKWHASCRHTHPSVDGLLSVMNKNSIPAADIDRITAYTYKAAMDILSMSERAETVHQSKFSMGFVLAVAAKNGHAMITDFTEEALLDPELRELQRRVEMKFDPEIDAVFPAQWTGRVEVTTRSGKKYVESVGVAKGDPGWTLTREEIESKFEALARYGKVKDLGQIRRVIQTVWNLQHERSVTGFTFT